MKVAQINMTSVGSTGKIMLNIAKTSRANGIDAMTFSTPVYSRSAVKHLPIEGHCYYGSRFDNTVHTVLGKLTGRNGCFSHIGTAELIKKLKEFNPDIIHLHNLHQFCINFPMLFRYIKKNNIRVIWTLHDCYTFTGHCPHFQIAKCDKWKNGCGKCAQYKKYPKTYVDASKIMYGKKKKWFSNVEQMTFVTPSEWLGGLVKQSFLQNYPVRVINNGIDLDVFKPTDGDFRKKYGLEDKKIILGVSFGWGYSKGLDVFEELAKQLDERYRIVLVGTNEALEQSLPDNVISVHRTDSQSQLAQIYTEADVFVNPTREDTFPTVNIEALACGTPTVTFDTGGSPEIIDGTCGSVVECGDTEGLKREIIRICTDMPYSKEACIARAKAYDMNGKFEEYVKLYNE